MTPGFITRVGEFLIAVSSATFTNCFTLSAPLIVIFPKQQQQQHQQQQQQQHQQQQQQQQQQHQQQQQQQHQQQQQQQTDLRRRFLPHQNDLFIFVGVVFSRSSPAVSTNSETSQAFYRASMPFTDRAVIIVFLNCSSVLTICELSLIHASASHLSTQS